jgi:hypothetical protein
VKHQDRFPDLNTSGLQALLYSAAQRQAALSGALFFLGLAAPPALFCKKVSIFDWSYF